jgi:glycosyltransferase involved in cell wall biosynthesis
MMTVMLATFNGERTLPEVLEAYLDLIAPDGGWQFVVIDNGSNDSTASILDRFEPLLPMKRLFVPVAGKNRALNDGLSMREGDLIVFTDDDAVPARDWLCEYRIAADKNPRFDIFGGAIRPRWEQRPEEWILDWVPQGITYTITDEALEDGPIKASSVWGPNMAVRCRLFDDGNSFEENIGPSQAISYPMGSETDFNCRMEKKGHRAWFVSTAVVGHIIRSYQLNQSWILARAARYGRGVFHRERLNKVTLPKRIFGIPRYQIPRLSGGAARVVAARLMGDTKTAFEESWNLRFNWGYAHECWRESRK